MKTNCAEIKPAKFGETLNGNPERSPENGERVETGRRVCIKCGNDIPYNKRKDAKYCSVKCRQAYVSWKYRVRKGLIENPRVGSGGNQYGTKNHMYKNGIASYNIKALDHYGKKCAICGSTKNIVVHHIDYDRTNNELENLKVLCKKHHQEIHCHRDQNNGQYIKGQSKPV